MGASQHRSLQAVTEVLVLSLRLTFVCGFHQTHFLTTIKACTLLFELCMRPKKVPEPLRVC